MTSQGKLMWNKAGRIGPADDVKLDDAPRTNASVEQKKQSITSRPEVSSANNAARRDPESAVLNDIPRASTAPLLTHTICRSLEDSPHRPLWAPDRKSRGAGRYLVFLPDHGAGRRLCNSRWNSKLELGKALSCFIQLLQSSFECTEVDRSPWWQSCCSGRKRRSPGGNQPDLRAGRCRHQNHKRTQVTKGEPAVVCPRRTHERSRQKVPPMS